MNSRPPWHRGWIWSYERWCWERWYRSWVVRVFPLCTSLSGRTSWGWVAFQVDYPSEVTPDWVRPVRWPTRLDAQRAAWVWLMRTVGPPKELQSLRDMLEECA